ncbi:MAG: putative lipid II flippase FtsW [Gammaproteobacteria bacterium]|nr:putative lipid II flippase FtsW [Gammaproteobacteria bacterium]
MSAYTSSFRPALFDDEQAVDLILLLALGALLGIGLVMVASASMSLAERDYGGPLYFFLRQLGAVAVGLSGAAVVLRIPMLAWQRLGPLLALGAFVLLAAVLLPGLGRTVNGSTRWLSIAGINVIQVSEPARLLLLLYLAGYAVRRNDALRGDFAGFARPLVLSGVACVLLLMQPDFGAALMLMAMTLAVLFIAGGRLRYFLFCVAGVAVVAGLAAVAAPYRVVRLTSFLDPWQDPYNTGFQLTQSLIAIGTGQWTGLGLGGSVQKLFYLPEAHTDFLFAVIAEEFGLVGSVLVIGLFCIVVWRALFIARQAALKQWLFHACIAFGFATWQALQVFINIGVNTGILPTKGLTLPLLSYGRSSMIVTLIGYGLLLRIDREIRTGAGGARRRSAGARLPA